MTSEGSVRKVRIRAKLPRGVALPHGGRVLVKIENISAADRPSETLVEEEFSLKKAQDGEWLSLEVPAGLIDELATYSASVHIAGQKSTAIALGDLISPAVHPVLTRGNPDEADIALVKVG